MKKNILVVVLSLSLAHPSFAWSDEDKTNHKRTAITASLIIVGVAVTMFGGYKIWKFFDPIATKHSIGRIETAGIDLGTTTSGVGHGSLEKVLVKDPDSGKNMTASAVQFDKKGKAVRVGEKALGEQGTATSSKRIIGTPFDYAIDKEKNLAIVRDLEEEHMAALKLNNGTVKSPEEIAAEVLKDQKKRIETELDKELNNAVITVPAYFFDFQKGATRKAGKLAGFKEVTLINEPTAAAFAHGIDDVDEKKMRDGVNYLVYDFGGGTFDVSIVQATLKEKGRWFWKKNQRVFKVVSIDGDPHLGGDDIDLTIAKKLASNLKRDYFQETRDVQDKLMEIAEKAKIHLSDADNREFTYKINIDGTELDLAITSQTFDDEIGELVKRTIDKTDEAIKLAKIENNKIDEVVLVGGSSRNLLVRERLINKFGEKKLAKSLQEKIDPDEMVARGASKYAQVLDENTDDIYKLSDIVPIGIRVAIDRGDEKKELLVLDEVIKRFADLPARGEIDGRSKGKNVTIEVWQGNTDDYDDPGNVFLGALDLKGQRAKEQIDIELEIDTDGILVVKAFNHDTGDSTVKQLNLSTPPKELRMREVVSDDEELDPFGEIVKIWSKAFEKQAKTNEELLEGQERTNKILEEILKELRR